MAEKKVDLENELKKIKVFVSERENHETQTKFRVFKALTKQGKIDLRFTKDVDDKSKPTKTCYLFVKPEHVNVNQKFEFAVMWIDEIDHLEDIEFKQNINDYLD